MTLPQRRFLIDTNTLIQPYKSYYAFDICPGYWEWLLAAHGQGNLASIDRVRNEVLEQDDDLAGWVKTTAPGGLFLPSTQPEVAAANRDIMNWVAGNYSQGQTRRFASGADSWLAAYAKVHSMVVVTQEFPRQRGKVPLPDVCKHSGVESEDLFDMLRELDVRFDWTRP